MHKYKCQNHCENLWWLKIKCYAKNQDSKILEQNSFGEVTVPFKVKVIIIKKQ